MMESKYWKRIKKCLDRGSEKIIRASFEFPEDMKDMRPRVREIQDLIAQLKFDLWKRIREREGKEEK